MKLTLSLITFFLSFEVKAGGGFTWMSSVSAATHIPGHVLTMGLVSFLLILTGLIYRSKVSNVENAVIPDKGITFRNMIELYGNFIYSQCKAVLGEKDAPKYFPFIATIFLLIWISNLLGLVPGFLPPTEYLSTTLALGCFSFIYYNMKGCKELGTINYLKHFAGPLWYMAILIFHI